MRFLDAQVIEPVSVQQAPVMGHPQAVVALSVGFSANLLNTVRYNGRIALNNGHHRALALRAMGMTHAPCLIQPCASMEDLQQAASSEILNNADLYFDAPRPPLLRDFDNPLLTHSFAAPRMRRVVTIKLDVQRRCWRCKPLYRPAIAPASAQSCPWTTPTPTSSTPSAARAWRPSSAPAASPSCPTAPEQQRNRDSDFLFRHDSYFYYLTGFTEPNAWLVITSRRRQHAVLQPQRRWSAKSGTATASGPEAAPERTGRERSASPAPNSTPCCPSCWKTAARSGTRSPPTGLGRPRRRAGCEPVRARVRFGALCPEQQRDLCGPLDEMRLIKDAHEHDVMRRAAQISAQAHIRAMQRSAAMIRAGQDVREYHLDAELLHEFRQHGSQYPAYGSIVAAGANACVLHYRADNAPVRDGELVLIDAGCELDGYASDITRTFPANGNFTGPQRDALRPGAGQPGSRRGRHPTRRPLHRPARRHGARAGAGHARPRPAQQERGRPPRRRDREAPLFPPLHAPHRPLAGPGRARLRQLRRAGRSWANSANAATRCPARSSRTGPAACCVPAWC